MIWPRGAIRRSTTIEHLVRLVKASGENKTIFFTWDERIVPLELNPESTFDERKTYRKLLKVNEKMLLALHITALEDMEGFERNQDQMFFSNYWHAYAYVQKSKGRQHHENG